MLSAIFEAAKNAAGAIVYFPPGRYYIGRTWRQLTAEIASQGAGEREVFGDFLVSANTVLKFAPGAVLVPYDYSVRLNRDDWAWGVPGHPWERYKVRIEIQGTIDAGAHQIFDVFLEDFDDPATFGALLTAEADLVPGDLDGHRLYYAEQLHPAGLIFFIRNEIRAVYPEWWGGAPPANSIHSTNPAAAVVRRTTLAIQAAIDAAHTHRRYLYAPNSTSRNKEPAEVLNLPPNELKCSPIPVLFSSQYVVDRELMVGQRWWEVERLGVPLSAAESVFMAFQGVNLDAAILRGIRASNRAGAGAAKIIASASHYFPDDRVDTPIVDRGDARRYGKRVTDAMLGIRSDALLAIRGVPSTIVEGIEFDGASTAARCLTLDNGVVFVFGSAGNSGAGGYASQLIGVERCQFTGATSRLVHVGGELIASDSVVNDAGQIKPLKDTRSPLHTWHFRSSNDLTALRFLRCGFNVPPPTQATPGSASTSRPCVGVMFYGEETLDLEFDRCAFSGPAAPMVHTFGGRVQFDGCVFSTPDLGIAGAVLFPGTTAYVPVGGGIDVFLDLPPLALVVDSRGNVSNPQSQGTGICVFRNVHSRSRTLISSRTEVTHGQATTGVLLIRVTHEPVPMPGRPLGPAIMWGSIAEFGARLVLMGCRFVRPIGSAGDVRSPVGVLLGGAYNATQFDDMFLREIEASRSSSAGHVIDLGTRIDTLGAGIVTSVVSLEPMVTFARNLFGDARFTTRVEALPVFEQYEMRNIP